MLVSVNRPASPDSSDEFVTPVATPPPVSPVAPRREMTARPHHEIIGDVCQENIISGSRCPRALVMTVNQTTPSHFHQAMSGPDSALWAAATQLPRLSGKSLNPRSSTHLNSAFPDAQAHPCHLPSTLAFLASSI
ncbi:hypothetical protein PCASD_04383 [Puccinia coronata f. sp. avenae]|uniref:Uncharacterized protein n=1 Tax=Puccinia coronata f. sp. avenae TaxID=200324 RepID=A0A2N5VBU7_9BASI|nr:hypothetical protein PCASD_04383 [Puccinia coronata f. sp. avenae]